ncbi:hypothetical protein ACBY01_09815 [Sphingomonas sp. ac-8]|uniref:hypothetical protein n=1 Tax=Sphingomonas sp. ac-8 TaxID=3242977 RepID=UPI003A8015E8
MQLVAERYVLDGMIPDEGDRKRLTAILGQPLASYALRYRDRGGGLNAPLRSIGPVGYTWPVRLRPFSS